jgi:hypothetical protein
MGGFDGDKLVRAMQELGVRDVRRELFTQLGSPSKVLYGARGVRR